MIVFYIDSCIHDNLQAPGAIEPHIGIFLPSHDTKGMIVAKGVSWEPFFNRDGPKHQQHSRETLTG